MIDWNDCKEPRHVVAIGLRQMPLEAIKSNIHKMIDGLRFVTSGDIVYPEIILKDDRNIDPTTAYT